VRDVAGESGGFFKLLAAGTTFWAALLPTLFNSAGEFLKGHAARALEMAQNNSQAFACLGSLSSIEREFKDRKTLSRWILDSVDSCRKRWPTR
jgi:hypothetical protein